MEYYVGIDPSIRGTAISFISTDRSKFTSYFFSDVKKYSKFEGDHIKHVFSKRTTNNDILQFDELTSNICCILKKYSIKSITLEGYSYRSKGLLYSIGEMVGLLKYKLVIQEKYKLRIVAPTEIKKYISKGNNDKKELYEYFCDHYSTRFGVSNEYFSELTTFINAFDLVKQDKKVGSPLSDVLDSLYISLFNFV